MTRTSKLLLAGAGVVALGYVLWREDQRTQSFTFAAGNAYTLTVQGSPTGSPASAVSAQAVLAAYGAPLVVTGVTSAASAGAPVLTLAVTASGAATLTGAQIAAAVGVTSGTFSVQASAPQPIVAVSSLGRMRRMARIR